MSALSLYYYYFYKALAILRRVTCLSMGISLTTCISSVSIPEVGFEYSFCNNKYDDTG